MRSFSFIFSGFFYFFLFCCSLPCRLSCRCWNWPSWGFLLEPMIEVSFVSCWELLALKPLFCKGMRVDWAIAVEVDKVFFNRDSSFRGFYVSSIHSLSLEDWASSVLFDIVIKLMIIDYLNSDGVLWYGSFAAFAFSSGGLGGFSQNLMVTHWNYYNFGLKSVCVYNGLMNE